MKKIVESITVMEPVTYETVVITGTQGPTLAGTYELNGWPLARCQPISSMIVSNVIMEPHVFARKDFRRGRRRTNSETEGLLSHEKRARLGPNVSPPKRSRVRYTYEQAQEPTWFIGGIGTGVKVSYFPLLPRDAEAFDIKPDKIEDALQSRWIENVELTLRLKADLPKQIEAEIKRANDSGLFKWNSLCDSPFLAISYDRQVFAEVKSRPDPIIIGWGHDEKWHVIAAWNIDIDLEIILR